MRSGGSDLHARRQIEALHRLGPRALAGFVDDLERKLGPDAGEAIDRLLAGYAALDPGVLQRIGADRWPAIVWAA